MISKHKVNGSFPETWLTTVYGQCNKAYTTNIHWNRQAYMCHFTQMDWNTTWKWIGVYFSNLEICRLRDITLSLAIVLLSLWLLFVNSLVGEMCGIMVQTTACWLVIGLL